MDQQTDPRSGYGHWLFRGLRRVEPEIEKPVNGTVIELPPPATEVPPPVVAADQRVEAAPAQSTVAEQLVSLAEAVERLETAVQTRLLEAGRSDTFIDRLEAEVKRLKQREDERRLEPAVKGVIALFDQVGAIVADATSREQEMSNAERELARMISALQKQMLELLNRLGATERVPAPASRLDAQWQEVVSTIETSDAGKQLTIAGVSRPAFEFAGRLCRPASVHVFRHTETQSQTKEK